MKSVVSLSLLALLASASASGPKPSPAASPTASPSRTPGSATELDTRTDAEKMRDFGVAVADRTMCMCMDAGTMKNRIGYLKVGLGTGSKAAPKARCALKYFHPGGMGSGGYNCYEFEVLGRHKGKALY